MKITLSIIAATVVLFGAITAKQIYFGEKQSANESYGSSSGDINNHGYLATEFLKFKKAYLYQGLIQGHLDKNLYKSNEVSDKVLFKLFIKYKTGKLY